MDSVEGEHHPTGEVATFTVTCSQAPWRADDVITVLAAFADKYPHSTVVEIGQELVLRVPRSDLDEAFARHQDEEL